MPIFVFQVSDMVIQIASWASKELIVVFVDDDSTSYTPVKILIKPAIQLVFIVIESL